MVPLKTGGFVGALVVGSVGLDVVGLEVAGLLVVSGGMVDVLPEEDDSV